MAIDKKRTMTRLGSVSYDAGKYKSIHYHVTAAAAATVLAAGYFNDMRADLQVNDIVHVLAGANGVGDYFALKITAVPASGDVTSETDVDVAGGGARAVVPTAVNGGATGQLLPTDKFVEATSANANHILTLPAASAATRGKEIWIWVVAGTNCELQTGGAGNTINNVDCSGGAVEALLTHTQLYVVRQHLATGWLLQAFTALGAVAAAIVPD